MIRTLKFAVWRDPANSRAIGYHATQMNAAYNVAVDALNREPDLPKRSGKGRPDAMNKRITKWRQANRQQAQAPYYIHQEGAEQAWEANQRLRDAREERLERIAKAEAKDEPPKHRDVRPHRRTLAHRSRKNSRLSLTVTDKRLFQISADGQTVASRQCGFTLYLRGKASLKFLDIRSIQLVPVKQYSPRTPLERRHYCLHAQVAVPEPMPLEELDIQAPEDILGGDRGRKNHAVFSSGERAHHPGAKQQGKRRKQHQRHIAGKPKNSKRRRLAVKQHGERARRYSQTRGQDLRKQISAILLEAQPKMVAVESLRCASMKASARGTAEHPGKNVAAKKKLNESLSEAAIGHVGKLLREEAAKLGIPTVTVPPQGTSQTCPRCNHRHQDNRESQAVFRCRNCGLYAHADWTASVIIRNRAYVRHREWQSGKTPSVAESPTGWREQPSDSEWQPMLVPLEYSVFKPKGSANSSPKERDPWPQAGEPYPQRLAQTPKVFFEELARETFPDTLSTVAGIPVSGHPTQFVNTL